MNKIKIISIFTAICIIFCFYGCHKKSENAVAVDKMIANLGKIEINDAEQIDQIDKAISKLTEEEKNELDKKKKFDQAKAKINELKKQERISDVENSINKIGEVTLNSEEAIENAENAYNSLTDNEKKSVSNISTLTNARKTFERLYSENKKEKIQNAKQYFSNFSKEKDEFQDVVWYYHKNMPEYIDIRSYVIPFFYIEDDNVIERIKELGVIDIENGELLISRKITPTRSQIKVNGQNFTAAQTQKLARYLIDVHGQHDNQILMDDANHLTVVDTFCADEIAELREAMEEAYKDMVKAKKALELIDKDKDELQKEIAFLEYEANEIQTADIQPDEDEELEARYHKLNNYQKITNELSYADMLLNSGNDNISDMIGTALKSLITASEYDDVLKECCDTLSDAEGLIRDAGHSISSYIENSEYDPREFSELQERLDLINNLKNKYGSSIEAINDTLKAINAKLADYYNFDELISRRKKEYEEACCKAWNIAQKLSSIRQQAAVKLAEQFIASLKNLNFLDVKFRIDFAKEPSLSSKGCDNVRFMISTNPGENLKPLSKIASGGELSRIMLAIKTVMSEDADKTLIFDEIDAGISGKTASKVSNQLARLSLSHQIICITHLPQIAAMADAHYIIEKSVHDNKTYSNIQRVAGDDSLNEIARMLSGETLTDSVLENAKELKIMADKVKSEL